MLRYFFLFLALCLMGCFASRNSRDMVRVPIAGFSFKPNVDENIYQMIDTASFYLRIEINGKDRVPDNSGVITGIRAQNGGVKFYANGRVGTFGSTNLAEVSSFDPKEARMGVYCLNEKGFFAEIAGHSPQVGVFLEKRKIIIKQDTLIMRSKGNEFKYLRTKLPDRLLVFKPDW